MTNTNHTPTATNYPTGRTVTALDIREGDTVRDDFGIVVLIDTRDNYVRNGEPVQRCEGTVLNRDDLSDAAWLATARGRWVVQGNRLHHVTLLAEGGAA